MQFGYARVSTGEQDCSMQVDALRAAGCERVFAETASGAATERPELAAALSHSRAGDILVIWRLDRLGRSLPHLIEIVGKLEQAGVGLRSLAEGIDTTTPNGRLIFRIFGALAEFERELIRERTRAGLASARARGRKGGRPPKLGAEKMRIARRLLDDADTTISEVARTLGVHRSTLHKALSASSPAVKPRGAARADTRRAASRRTPSGPAKAMEAAGDLSGKHRGQTA